MNSNRRMVFFIEWDTDLINFIKGITLSPSLRGTIVVHIFYRHDVSWKSLPKYQPWLFKHPASVEQTDSAWKLLESYVTSFKFEANYTLTPVKKSRPKCAASLSTRDGSFVNSDSNATRAYYVISKSTRGNEELAKTLYKKQRVKLEFVEFKPETTLLDFVQFKCPYCFIAFTGKTELNYHDRAVHGFVCPNQECKFNKKENSFQQESDLKQHIQDQLRCPFCPTKVFCSPDVLEIHKRNSHKKCACPCGRYFGDRLEYLDHFFAVYPSPASISSSPAASGIHNGKVESVDNRSPIPGSYGRKKVAEKHRICSPDKSAISPLNDNQTVNRPDSCNFGGCMENAGHD